MQGFADMPVWHSFPPNSRQIGSGTILTVTLPPAARAPRDCFRAFFHVQSSEMQDSGSILVAVMLA